MLSIVILGAAAGGGVPQWNCGCPNCRAARLHPERASTQASVAISIDDENWFLINASPDLRQQLNATPQLHPRDGKLRDSPIAGVVLTNGEVDAVAGLLTLREGSRFTIHAHQRVLDLLDANPIFSVLRRDLVARQRIELDTPFSLTLPNGSPSGLTLVPFAVPGKIALYLEDNSENAEGDTIGLEITDGERRVVFLAACAQITAEVRDRLTDADLVFFDGTLWRDDEMIALGLSQKTGQRMGHMAMSQTIPNLAEIAIGQRVFLHINHSNPALDPHTSERQHATDAGWVLPHDGMEIRL